jgi:hypothetical protein
MSKKKVYFSSNETIDTLIEENSKMEKDIFKIALKKYVDQIEDNNFSSQNRQMFIGVIMIILIMMAGIFIAYANS